MVESGSKPPSLDPSKRGLQLSLKNLLHRLVRPTDSGDPDETLGVEDSWRERVVRAMTRVRELVRNLVTTRLRRSEVPELAKLLKFLRDSKREGNVVESIILLEPDIDARYIDNSEIIVQVKVVDRFRDSNLLAWKIYVLKNPPNHMEVVPNSENCFLIPIAAFVSPEEMAAAENPSQLLGEKIVAWLRRQTMEPEES